MTIWFTSDTHFSHAHPDLLEKRGFKDIVEMNEKLIAEWNRWVKPSDHIYHLGDVSMKLDPIKEIMPQLNGHKRLIRGNHDIFDTKDYLKHFDEVMGVRIFDQIVFSHFPIAPWSMDRYRANVHGHTHLATPLTYKVPNPRGESGFDKQHLYVNISTERTRYRPVSLEQIQELVKHA